LLTSLSDHSDEAQGNDADNTSYAFINISNDGRVTLLDRGYGTDPWDPNKVVLTVSPA
jgi:hypothetical protein